MTELMRDRREDVPSHALAVVRSTVASPAERTDQDAARVDSKPPLTTGLPVGQAAPILVVVVVAVVVVVSVIAGRGVAETVKVAVSVST